LGKAINAYVIQDEARRVTFGRLALRHFYPTVTQAECDEREEFCVGARYLTRDAFICEEVFERLELPVELTRYVAESDMQKRCRDFHFMRIVPALKDIGL
jgi:hypothetical protein